MRYKIHSGPATVLAPPDKAFVPVELASSAAAFCAVVVAGSADGFAPADSSSIVGTVSPAELSKSVVVSNRSTTACSADPSGLCLGVDVLGPAFDCSLF